MPNEKLPAEIGSGRGRDNGGAAHTALDRHTLWRCWAAAAIAACALPLAAAGESRAGATHLVRLRCTNPASGASWPIVVDLDHDRVDSLAATITGNRISWRDPKRGFFDLDRATGKLQLRNASATGGYFLYYSCRPD